MRADILNCHGSGADQIGVKLLFKPRVWHRKREHQRRREWRRVFSTPDGRQEFQGAG